MSVRVRFAAVAAFAVLTLPACRKSVDDVDPVGLRTPETARERCRAAFEACAPPVRFSSETDVRRLNVRKLVLLSSRLDVEDRLSAAAAKRLLEVVKAADEATLLDVREAIDDSALSLERCRCPDFPPEIEKQGVAAFVAARAAPRATRTPAHWAEQILPPLADQRALARRAAELLAGGDEALAADVDVRLRAADQTVCERVHAARAALSTDAFVEALELVYRKRSAEAGEGSADAARRAIARHQSSPSCAGP